MKKVREAGWGRGKNGTKDIFSRIKVFKYIARKGKTFTGFISNNQAVPSIALIFHYIPGEK